MAAQLPTDRRHKLCAKLEALLLFLLLTPAATNAEGTFPLRILLAPEQRVQAAGRQMYVMTDRELLASRIQPLGLASAVGGGLLNIAIDQAVEESREHKAKGPLEDIRGSLANYDLSQKTAEAAAQISTALGWLNVKNIRSMAGKEIQQEDVSTMTGAEALIFQYKLLVEPRFDAIRLSAHADLVTKALLGKLILGLAKKTTTTDGLLFSQDFIVFVPLQGKKSDIQGNAALWAENNGQLARQSIELALSGVTRMMTSALVVSEAEREVVSAKKARRVGHSDRTADNYYGKIVSEDDSGVLLETRFGEWVYYYWPTHR